MKPNSITEQLAIGPWHAEGRARDVAATVLRQPKRFDELFESLLHPDKGVSKRASFALLLVSEQHPELLQPYKNVLFDELEGQDKWYVRYRLCLILPRLKLSRLDIGRAAGIFQSLMDDEHLALRVNALKGLAELALLDPSQREDTIWTIEKKIHHGGPSIRAAGRMMLKRLYRVAAN